MGRISRIQRPAAIIATTKNKVRGGDLLSQLSQFGTVTELFMPEDGTFDVNNLYSAWTGKKGTILSQPTPANRFKQRIVNGKKVLWSDSVEKYLFAANPFASLTDCTFMIAYRATNVHILLGEGINADRSWFSATSGSSTVDSGFGAPTYRVNGVPKVWANASFVGADINNQGWVIVTARSASFATWANFYLNWRSGVNTSSLLGHIACIAVFQDNLSDVNVAGAESKIQAHLDTLPYNVYAESFSTIVADTDGGGNLANTGLSYDSVRDELAVNEYQMARGGRILIFDRQTLAFKRALDISAHIHTIQGLGLDAVNGIYYVLGTPTSGTDGLSAFDINGNLLFRRNWNSLGLSVSASLTFYNGSLYYYHAATVQVSKINPTTLAVEQVFTVSPLIAGSACEGLAVVADGYWLGEAGILRKYQFSTNILMEEAPGTAGEPEGLAVDPDGNVYINRDLFFHGATVGGNRLYKHTRSVEL
jgi:hypothetical protein